MMLNKHWLICWVMEKDFHNKKLFIVLFLNILFIFSQYIFLKIDISTPKTSFSTLDTLESLKPISVARITDADDTSSSAFSTEYELPIVDVQLRNTLHSLLASKLAAIVDKDDLKPNNNNDSLTCSVRALFVLLLIFIFI
jgi:hypothetical protein